jgi:hypothetical protein
MLDFNDAEPQSHLRLAYDMAWEARSDRLRKALDGRARDLVDYVFPSARVHGAEARIGSTDGEPGESLAINLTTGVWFDHATGEGGDLIELWKATQSATFPEAIDDLERWSGLGPAPAFTSRVHRVAERRKEEAKKHAGVDAGIGAPVASWYYKSPDDTLIGIVRRYDLAGQFDEAGKPKKTFRPFTASGEARMPDPRPLYRLPQISTASTVVLVEGEKCADALEKVGVEATTVMGGANTHLEKTDFTPLAGKTVLLWPDNDGLGKTEKVSFVGQRYMERLKVHLEALGCRVGIVDVPAGKPAKWDAADAVAEGEDVTAILARAIPDTTAPPTRRFKLLSIADLETLEPLSWLVDGALPAGGFLGLYGPSGGLKSFVAIDIALHIATGQDWHGKQVSQGPVVYVAGEGRRGLAKRVLGWRAHHQINPLAFHLIAYPVAVTTTELDELVATIGDMPIKPVLVVLDTLARTFGPGDENSQQDMSAYVRACDRLAEITGSAVMIVHHTGKDENRGLRGSNALLGALDTNIFVKRSGRKVELINEAPHGKQKDADEFETVLLVATPFAFDHQGEREGTLILLSGIADNDDQEAEEGSEQGKVGKPQGANQHAIMKTLRAAKGEPLGLTRLSAMTKIDASALSKALRSLTEKGLIEATGMEGAKRWITL